ncbi:MAG: hypothetical protein D3924_16880 [Candidatus Electrothrix sp. AR4]|nr:hypothetical protein [Candidatus Electrothrix sp. AR4]
MYQRGSALSTCKKNGLTYEFKELDMKECIHDGSSYFLSRPRRFGKSLLLNNTMQNLFSGSKALFEGCCIYNKWNRKKYSVIKILWMFLLSRWESIVLTKLGSDTSPARSCANLYQTFQEMHFL